MYGIGTQDDRSQFAFQDIRSLQFAITFVRQRVALARRVALAMWKLHGAPCLLGSVRAVDLCTAGAFLLKAPACC